MSEARRCWRRSAGCVIVRVRLRPKSSFDAIDGLETTADGPALKARVRALPEDGKANTAVARLLADWLGVPGGDVAVTGGHKSRVKSLTVHGEPGEIERRLEARTAGLAAK